MNKNLRKVGAGSSDRNGIEQRVGQADLAGVAVWAGFEGLQGKGREGCGP